MSSYQVGRRRSRRVAIALVSVVACSLVGCAPDPVKPPVTLDQGAALQGPDSNNDGIRDDVGKIIESLPTTEAVKNELRTFAKNQQEVMALDLSGDPQATSAVAYEVATETNRIISCLPADVDFDEFDERSDVLDAVILNTDQRRDQMAAFEHLIDGRSFPEPAC